MRATLRFTLLALLLGTTARAQTSASYALREQVFNGGGNPEGGTVLVSVSYRVRLDAIGEGVGGIGLASASYRQDGGFVVAYPPPGEVLDVRLDADKTMLSWLPESSVGTYNLYRDALSALAGLDYGACLVQEIAGESTSDADVPSAGAGYFYLVTAANRLYEEGTKGFASSSAEREGAVCP
jgi:hypothetical protein